jgi:hypothetical protein
MESLRHPKFLVLYPHAKQNFRVCLVDPPDLHRWARGGLYAGDDRMLAKSHHCFQVTVLNRPLVGAVPAGNNIGAQFICHMNK